MSEKLNIDRNNQYTLMDRLKVITCLLLASYLEQCHCDFPKVMRHPRSEGSCTYSGKVPPLYVLVLSQRLPPLVQIKCDTVTVKCVFYALYLCCDFKCNKTRFKNNTGFKTLAEFQMRPFKSVDIRTFKLYKPNVTLCNSNICI